MGKGIPLFVSCSYEKRPSAAETAVRVRRFDSCSLLSAIGDLILLHRSRVFVFFFLINFFGPHTLFAVPDVVAQPSQESEYDRIINQAINEYDLGNWYEALVLFKKAHELDPNARTLRGMGLAAFEDRRYVDAVRWFSEALRHPKRPLTPAMRKKTEQILGQSRAYLGFYKLDVEPGQTIITVDGREPFVENGMIKMDPGERNLVASAVGFKAVRRRLQVKGGNNGVLHLELQPLASSNWNSSLKSNPKLALEDSGHGQSSDVDLWGWVSIGTGGACLVIGGTLIGLVIKDYNAVKNAEGSAKEIEDAQQRVHDYSWVGIPLSVLGVGGIGLGILLLNMDDGELNGSTNAHSKLSLRFGLNRVQLHGGF